MFGLSTPISKGGLVTCWKGYFHAFRHPAVTVCTVPNNLGDWLQTLGAPPSLVQCSLQSGVSNDDSFCCITFEHEESRSLCRVSYLHSTIWHFCYLSMDLINAESRDVEIEISCIRLHLYLPGFAFTNSACDAVTTDKHCKVCICVSKRSRLLRVN